MFLGAALMLRLLNAWQDLPPAITRRVAAAVPNRQRTVMLSLLSEGFFAKNGKMTNEPAWPSSVVKFNSLDEKPQKR